jgi:hypothetical protein
MGKETLFVVVGLALLISGCSSSSANVVSVQVSPSSFIVLAGQVQTFTATVGGSSTTTVSTWPCTYSFTPSPTTANPNPKAVTGPCSSGGTFNSNGETGSFGTWTISTANGSNVLTYTAPTLDNFPKPFKPTFMFAATADADKHKTGTATVGLDSGIRVQISPITATVPVGITPPVKQTFSVTFQNSPPVNVQYKLVQPNTANTTNTNNQTPNPQADTCTVSSPTSTMPGCGSIDANGIYTPPMTLPTDTVPSGSKSTSPTTVYVVAWSGADQSEFAVATITLVNATTNPSSYSGLYPDTVAAGGVLQDIFLNAKNLLNSVQIFFISPRSAANLNAAPAPVPLNNATQVFTIPVSGAYCTPTAASVTPVITCDASILTRVRLLADQLKQAEPVVPQGQPPQPAWIEIASLPGTPTVTPPCVLLPGSTSSIACPLHILNASPALVAAVPDSFQQASGFSNVSIGVDGGYYGETGSFVNLLFDGQKIPPVTAGPRQLVGTAPSFQLPNPGLYEVSVNSTTASGTPPTFTTATTNAAVQPNFANFTPNKTNSASTSCIDPSLPPNPAHPNYLSGAYPNCVILTGGGNPAPSDIALDSINQFAVIAEQGTGSLQLVDLSGLVPAQSGSPIGVGTANSQPTGVALDTQLNLTVNGKSGGDLLAVVASGDNKLYLYGVSPPKNGLALSSLLGSFAIDLPTLLGLPASTTTLGGAFSIGIDPGTHLGVIAYANTNVGFIVDVNPNLDHSDTHTCFLAGQMPPCAIAPVSVVTGSTPKVVMAPNAPLAYVTPGGGTSNTSVVDLLQQAKVVQIAPFVSGGTSGAVRTAGITKIITTTDNGINPVLGGTVIISGVMPTAGKSCSNFNGTFQILPGTITPFTFSYSQPDQISCDDIESNPPNMLGTVEYGVPFFSFGTGALVSGAAINPITHTFGFANYNNSSGQLGFISTLDQSQTSLSLTTGSCQTCTGTTGAPEIGFRSVSFDQFTNVLVAYAPSANMDPNEDGNKISLVNPGGPTANGTFNPPTRIIAATPVGQIGQGSYTPSGATSAVPVYGPMVYDPKSKFILVANAGSNSLSYMSLDPGNTFQQVHILDLQLPNPACQNLADPTTCYGVPVVQPPLSSAAPAHAPGICNPGSPTQPCMPHAVQVGKKATVHILGQGFSNIAPPNAINPPQVPVRLDGQAGITPPGATQPINITGGIVSDSEIDVTLPAAVLFAPHDYAIDVPVPGGGTTNAIGLHVLGLLDMASGGANGCVPTSSFPQGPEAVAIDQTRHVALVTNFACNSVSVITLNPSGFMAAGGMVVPYGGIIGSVAVGHNPLGIAVLPRMGYAVVANSGDTPNGTAMIIDYANQQTPDNPKVVTFMVTTGSGSSASTTTESSVAVGLSPVGVGMDQDHALALIANNGSNTITSIDLTVLLPDDPAKGGGHVHSAPTATTVALSGPPTAIAVDPNRAVAVVTNLQNSGTTAVTGGLDVVSLSTTPPVKTSTGSISSLSASLTGIVYDPGDPNNTTSTTTGVFFATSTQSNAIYSFNPDTGSAPSIQVGINPYSLGYNYQTGTLLTINSTSNSSSVVDVLNFRTRQTLGITSMSQFAIDVDNFSNVAVIADQNNNRLIYLEMPK